MKITRQQLRRLIRESLDNSESETWPKILMMGKDLLVINKVGDKYIPEIVGTIRISDYLEDCIPKTKQVSFIRVLDDQQGKGYGTMLYMYALADGAFYEYGLTSDQSTGTKAGARGTWNKLIKKGVIQSRETDAGNDVFDYFEKTPDPDDDCIQPRNMTATNQSWELVEPYRSQWLARRASDRKWYRSWVRSLPKDIFKEYRKLFVIETNNPMLNTLGSLSFDPYESPRPGSFKEFVAKSSADQE